MRETRQKTCDMSQLPISLRDSFVPYSIHNLFFSLVDRLKAAAYLSSTMIKKC